jgi:transcriptional regulator with XRE-family HTH domain
MMGNISLNMATDAEIMRQLGERLRALGEAQALTTIEAATQTGLSRRTVYRAEHGLNPTLETLVRLLRLYGRLNSLAELAPEPEASPMALMQSAKTQRHG